LQYRFAEAVLKEAKLRGLDTAIETCGFAHWENMKMVLQYANTIFYDIKSMDPEKHLKYTGVDNKIILENFKQVVAQFSEKSSIIVRTPVIPGFNNNKKDIQAIADFLKPFKNIKYQLLPYHSFGEIKYNYLDRNYLLPDLKKLTGTEINELNQIAALLD
jgi:pyruvate formate lyase activating enzyme